MGSELLVRWCHLLIDDAFDDLATIGADGEPPIRDYICSVEGCSVDRILFRPSAKGGGPNFGQKFDEKSRLLS